MLDQPAAVAASVSQPAIISDGWYPGKAATAIPKPTAAPALRDEFEDAREMARRGHKINAIKLVRDKTGWGLREAKDFVESPAFGVPSATKTSVPGGLSILLLIIFVVVVGVIYLSKSVSGPASFATAPRSPQRTAPGINVQPQHPAAATAAPTAPATARNIAHADHKAIDVMVENGLIKRMDLASGKFYIDGPLWVGFELDAKENIVKVISAYREAEYKGLPQVTLYESRSGKELDSYGVFGGVTIR